MLRAPVFSAVRSPIRAPINGRANGGISYLTDGRAWDLGLVGATEVVDLSGNGNAGVEHTGIYASSDGVADQLINADCSDLGSASWRLSVMFRPAEVGFGAPPLRLQINDDAEGAAFIDVSVLTLSWHEFSQTFIDGLGGITPSNVVLGFSTGSGEYSQADWSDIKLTNLMTGEVVRHWPLIDSAAADLDGLPCLETIAGNHGVHEGGAGGSGEAGILQTAGMDFNKRMWFDGTSNHVGLDSQITASGDFFISFRAKFETYAGDGSRIFQSIGAAQTVSFPTSAHVRWRAGGNNYDIELDHSIPSNSFCEYRLVRTGTTLTLLVDGVLQADSATVPLTNFQVLNIGGNKDYQGILSDININNQAIYNGHGATDSDWTDRVGANDGTINGTAREINIATIEGGTETVYGSPLDLPRASSSVINLTADDASFEIADHATLGAIKSVGVMVYYTGLDGTVLDLGTPTITLTSGTVATTGITTPTIYVDGVASTSIGATGWHYIEVTTATAFDAGPVSSSYRSQLSKPIGWTVEHDAAAVLQNFNGLKSSVGL